MCVCVCVCVRVLAVSPPPQQLLSSPPDVFGSVVAEVCCNLALARLHMHTPSDAASALQRALAACPTHPRARALVDVVSAALDPSAVPSYLTVIEETVAPPPSHAPPPPPEPPKPVCVCEREREGVCVCG